MDPIANFLSMLKNAIMRRQQTIVLYRTRTIEAMLGIMRDEGYIVDYTVKESDDGKTFITVYLKYKSGVSAINGLRRVSKPGHRVYSKAKDLPIVMNGMGTSIVSTSRGIMDEKVCRKLGLGGEVMAQIW